MTDLPDLGFLDQLETPPMLETPVPDAVVRTRLVDSQRTRVYRAEAAFHPATARNHIPGLPRFPVVYFTRPELLAFVRKVESSDWWGEHACEAARNRPVQVTTRQRRNGQAIYHENRIKMPEWTWYDEYILHELAHLAVGAGPQLRREDPAHGRLFVAMLHGLITEFMGVGAALVFEGGCRRERVKGCPTVAHTAPVAPAPHEFPLAAGQSNDTDALSAWAGYAESYRRYRRGERSSAPKPRKGMTPSDIAAVKAAVDQTL